MYFSKSLVEITQRPKQSRLYLFIEIQHISKEPRGQLNHAIN